MKYCEWYQYNISPFISSWFLLPDAKIYTYKYSLPLKSVQTSFTYFQVSTTGSMRHDKKIIHGEGYLSSMSPLEYMLRCGLQIRKTSLKTWFDGSLQSFEVNSTVDSIAKDMQNGILFDTPYIDYKIPAQDGRHRAMATWMLGITEIPVWIFL